MSLRQRNKGTKNPPQQVQPEQQPTQIKHIASPHFLSFKTILFLAILIVYFFHVPSDVAELGSLHDLKHMTESIPYDEATWPNSGYADVALGKIHYYLVGPESGRKLVFVHGLTNIPIVYQDVLNGLAQKGYRVLCYDLYGRGYSDSPGFPHNEKFYVAQLALLLDRLEFKPSIVMGYSLGGGIATAFTTLYPDRVDKLILVAPAGLMQTVPLLGHVVSFPVLGPLIAHTVGRWLYAHRIKNAIAMSRITDPDRKQHIIDLVIRQLDNHPGYVRALQSTLHHFPITVKMKYYYETLHQSYGLAAYKETEANRYTTGQVALFSSNASSILALWAQEDQLITLDCRKYYESLVPSSHVYVVKESGHELLIEKPEESVNVIHAWLLGSQEKQEIKSKKWL